jgi:nitrogen fixation protein NifZ
MTGQIAVKPKPRPVARVVCDAGRRKTVRNMETRFTGRFEAGEPIRAVAVIKNDGMYPHKDIGEALVRAGDTGIIRESWRFLGETYYTVEFIAQSVFVIMRGCEMTRVGTAFHVSA